MTEKQYSFKNTRFNCGCAYRTMSEDLVFCPEHRHSSPVGFITGKETTQSPGPEVPQIPGLVMDPYIQGRPKTMMNTSANSLHTRTYVLDGKEKSGATPRTKSVSATPASSTRENLIQPKSPCASAGKKNAPTGGAE